MDTDNLLRLTNAHDLVCGGALFAKHAVEHGREARAVDRDLFIGEAGTGLRLSETDSADRRVSEHRSGNIVIVKVVLLEALAAKQAVRETTASCKSDGGERDPALHITNRVNVGHIRVLVTVDSNVTTSVSADASLLEAQVLRVRLAADCPDQCVNLDYFARHKCDAKGATLLAIDALDIRVGVDLHARLGEFFHERVSNDGVKVAQRLVVAHHKMSLGAELLEQRCKLNCNVPRTDKQRTLGLLLECKEAVRVDTKARARDLVIARRARTATGGNYNVVSRDNGLFAQTFTIFSLDRSHMHLAIANEATIASNVVDLVLREIVLIYTVKAADVRVALLHEGRPVDLRHCRSLAIDFKAVFGSGTELFQHATRLAHDLLGHTAHIHACATKTARALDNSYLLAVVCGRATSSTEATRATADNDGVIVLTGLVDRGHFAYCGCVKREVVRYLCNTRHRHSGGG